MKDHLFCISTDILTMLPVSGQGLVDDCKFGPERKPEEILVFLDDSILFIETGDLVHYRSPHDHGQTRDKIALDQFLKYFSLPGSTTP